MKNLFWAAVVGMVALCVFIGYDQAQNAKKAKKLKDDFTGDTEYRRGFMEGMNATIKHVKIDTNTGKANLELTDVLAEMKPPTNQPPQTNAWPPSKSPKK
jgi:hypothetical protein